ncbi:MAG: GTPase, partial [Firmicutes bacterium]|nr:GTPase [Bacillota bacterium]
MAQTQNNQQKELPVYLFTGFLEAGKSKFIKGTLEDPRFNAGDRTLFLLCEEGEVEFDEDLPQMENVFIEVIENESDLTPKVLSYLEEKHQATRVLVEYNGMWRLISLFNNMPDHWAVYQEFMFIDSNTFLAYNKNMRELMVDKFATCDMVVFNRFKEGMDQLLFHKIVRAVSRRANIAYEYENGEVEYDDLEDPLPFDMEADVIEIDDDDYALWYRDISEDMRKYNGKTIEFKGIAVYNNRVAPGTFAFGRQVMTCCEADIQYCSLLAQCPPKDMPINNGWYKMRMKVEIKFHKMYGEKGPILNVISMENCPAP